MPVSIIVGGQFGSEGKGKVAYFFARQMAAAAVLRVGGPNSGHTVIRDDGTPLVLKQLPTAALLNDVLCVLPAGSYIYPDLLLEEIRVSGLHESRLIVDPNAVVIGQDELDAEKGQGLREAIGSTNSGTGAGLIKRISRKHGVKFAANEGSLKQFIRPTLPLMRKLLQAKKRIIIEGTQGHGLSVLHTEYYPYCTSRDTTAAGFLSEAGLSPVDVDDIVLVIRTFPIRVGGKSGPLSKETDWKTVTEYGGSKTELIEFTSVTQTVRRVAFFDPQVVYQAIAHNNPTKIVMNHMDYIDAGCSEGVLTKKAEEFIATVEQKIGRRIDYVGTSPAALLAIR